MIIIHRSSDKQFYFTIRATNGRTVATSETYKRKTSAIKTAKRLQLNTGGKIQDHTNTILTK